MMNTLPAKELKRCGVIALEKRLSQGPVHVMKNNRPVCVVLSQAEYARLTGQTTPTHNNLWDWLDKPVTGRRTREEIDAFLNIERDNWE